MTNSANKTQSLSRRQLLFGRSSSVKVSAAIRPPWSANQIAKCTGCGNCVSACPEEILSLDIKLIPEVHFNKGECTFCGMCAEACPEPVFECSTSPWDLEINVGDQCFLNMGVFCMSCGDACPSQAVGFKPKLGRQTYLEIDNLLCTSCGACISVCPANAITIGSKVSVEGEPING